MVSNYLDKLIIRYHFHNTDLFYYRRRRGVTSSTFSSTSITAASSTSSAQGTTKAPTISLVSSTTKATSSSAQGTTVGGLKRKGIFSWDYFLLHSFAYIMYFVKLGSCSYLLKCLNSNLNVSIQKQKEQS